MKCRILFSAKETICMKCQILFSGKNKNTVFMCRLLKSLPRLLIVKQIRRSVNIVINSIKILSGSESRCVSRHLQLAWYRKLLR